MATNYKIISPKALIEKFEQALNEKWGYIWGTAGVMWTESRQAALNRTTDSNREMGRKYGKKWIAAEYDSEPREIIILGDALPDAGETITLEITDDSKRKIKKEIAVPGF